MLCGFTQFGAFPTDVLSGLAICGNCVIVPAVIVWEYRRIQQRAEALAEFEAEQRALEVIMCCRASQGGKTHCNSHTDSTKARLEAEGVGARDRIENLYTQEVSDDHAHNRVDAQLERAHRLLPLLLGGGRESGAHGRRRDAGAR